VRSLLRLSFFDWCVVLSFFYLLLCMFAYAWCFMRVDENCLWALKIRRWWQKADDVRIKQVFKASITWDHPCYLFTYNYTYMSYACYHLVDLSKIIDDCYLDSLLPTWYAFGVDVLVLDIIHDLVRWLIAMQWTLKDDK
jgi:hypothetical protein